MKRPMWFLLTVLLVSCGGGPDTLDEGGTDVLPDTGRDTVIIIDYGVQEDLEQPVSYTHLRAHETVLELVYRLLLEKKNTSHLYTNHN